MPPMEPYSRPQGNRTKVRLRPGPHGAAGGPRPRVCPPRPAATHYTSGQVNAIYEKWFLEPVPPRGLTLNIPMGDQLKKVVANPTDSGDQATSN